MLLNYLKMAAKVLLRRKLFTAISLCAITFTLVILLLVAAFLDQAFGPVGPMQRQDRTVAVYGWLQGDRVPDHELGYQVLDRHGRGLPGAEATSLYLDTRLVTTYRQGAPVRVHVKRTDADFWRVLAFTFLEGGPYTTEDVRQARPVVVISESTRARFFDGAPALGRTIAIDDQRLRVVGVVRDAPPTRRIPEGDVWAPLTTAGNDAYRIEAGGGAKALILARSAADVPAMEQELRLRLARWLVPDPRGYQRVEVALRTGWQDAIHNIDRNLFGRDDGPESHAEKLAEVWTLIVLVVLGFMLVPAANLINLNVSRILERAVEIGVRKSFGASARALVGQFLVGNVVLTLVGGALALLVTSFLLRALTASGLFPWAELAVSSRVFLGGLGLALLFGLVSGVYPAWKMARLHPVAALRRGRR
jgi:putative ABC transport system permease protein